MSKVAKAIGIDVGGTNLRIGVFEALSLIDEIRVQADFSAICKTQLPQVAWQTILNVTAEGIKSVLTNTRTSPT